MGELREFRRRKRKPKKGKGTYIDPGPGITVYYVLWKKRVGKPHQREIYETLEAFACIHEAFNLHALKYQLGEKRNKYEDEFIRITKLRMTR